MVEHFPKPHISDPYSKKGFIVFQNSRAVCQYAVQEFLSFSSEKIIPYLPAPQYFVSQNFINDPLLDKNYS